MGCQNQTIDQSFLNNINNVPLVSDMETGDPIGSSFAISPHFIVTVYHITSRYPHICFNNIPGTLYQIDPQHDIAIYAVPSHNFRIYELDNPQLGEEVNNLGWINILHKTRLITNKLTTTNLDIDGYLLFTGAVHAGMSGGPILNKNGKVIGINSACPDWAEGTLPFPIPNSAIVIGASSKYINPLFKVYN